MPSEPSSGSVSQSLYDLLTGDEDARVCKDIDDSACREQPRSYLVHLGSLVFTKIGDEIAGAKLTLTWVMASLGAPAFLTGLLVPIRESLSLMPQLLVAGAMRRHPLRKWFWVAGSLAQGLAVIGIAGVVASGLEGAGAGWAVIGLLVVFSLARGVCSVAHKDVLGKTVSKTRRGSVGGYATAVAGLAAVAVGIYLHTARDGGADGTLVFLLLVAGTLWLLGALVFAGLPEVAGATTGGGNAIDEALRHLNMLRTDQQLREFLLTRLLLLSTALSAPYYVVLAREQSGEEGLATLGALIIASGIASAVSAPFWGRRSDRSSRQVMIAAALIAAVAGVVTAGSAMIGWSWATSPVALAGALFALNVAHAGVRLGRKTYLVDMSTQETRAAYVALSNTVIGVCLLLIGSLVGALAVPLGASGIVFLLALLALAAAAMAWRLDEVEL